MPLSYTNHKPTSRTNIGYLFSYTILEISTTAPEVLIILGDNWNLPDTRMSCDKIFTPKDRLLTLNGRTTSKMPACSTHCRFYDLISLDHISWIEDFKVMHIATLSGHQSMVITPKYIPGASQSDRNTGPASTALEWRNKQIRISSITCPITACEVARRTSHRWNRWQFNFHN